MLVCNLTPLDGRFVNAIVFCRKFKFCEYITSLHIQHSIYVRQFEFFVFTMKQIASIFCNVSFAGQYIRKNTFQRKKKKIWLSPYTHRKFQEARRQHKRQQNASITQRLRTDVSLNMKYMISILIDFKILVLFNNPTFLSWLTIFHLRQAYTVCQGFLF